VSFSYNGLRQLNSITAFDPAGNPQLDYDYSYNASGTVSDKTTEHGDYSYQYDALYRLTGVDSPVEEQSYGYDPLGNRISSTESSDWDYNSNNQLTGYTARSFSYDNHGNMIARTVAGSTTSFSYTVDNRLQQISDTDGVTSARYYYDPYGRRLFKEVAGQRTYFHYNDEGLVGEYSQDGSEQRRYGYFPGSAWSSNPLFILEDQNYYWDQNDHLGTPQKIIAENGSVVWQARYLAFGGIPEILIEDIVNNLRFPGQYFDSESGLYYNWHRFYDPETGRYVTSGQRVKSLSLTPSSIKFGASGGIGPNISP
jgi:RHS repeat-associated protein